MSRTETKNNQFFINRYFNSITESVGMFYGSHSRLTFIVDYVVANAVNFLSPAA